MHPLFSTRSALPAYLLAWAGLSMLPALVLNGGSGGALLSLSATLVLAVLSMPVYFACRALPLGRGLGRVLGIQGAIALALALAFALALELGAHALSIASAFGDLPLFVAARRAETFGALPWSGRPMPCSPASARSSGLCAPRCIRTFCSIA